MRSIYDPEEEQFKHLTKVYDSMAGSVLSTSEKYGVNKSNF